MTAEATTARIEPVVAAPAPLQRACACGTAAAHARECDGCRKERVQRSASGPAPPRLPDSVAGVVGTTGAPLDDDTRRTMEGRFGHDFSHIRIHTDDRAAASARDTAARAYTVGSHIVFGTGQYVPRSHAGRHLLAHELTHTLQQQRGIAMQPQGEGATASEDPAEREADRVADQVTAPRAGVVVENDAADLRPGQMRKSEFLEAVRASACEAADAELARAGRSTAGCPYVEQAFETYRGASAERVNRSISMYVGAADSAAVAIRAITTRVREGVRTWVETGAVPEAAVRAAESPAAETGAPAAPAAPAAAPPAAPAAQAKLRDGGVPSIAPDAASVQASLGEGAPLDSGVRVQMERSFGFDFAGVRIHTDSRAAATATRHDALALTVGNDIAFAPGEYQPDALAGSALLAHELAHVVQQRDGTPGGGSAPELEDDADVAAAHAVAGSFSGLRRFMRRAMPRMRSGLQLSRCARCPKSDIRTRALSVFQLAGSTIAPAADVSAASTIWRDGAGIELNATFYPAVDEPTTRRLIGGDQPAGTPVGQLEVAVDGTGATTTTDNDNLAAHASAAGATGIKAFYVPRVLFGGYTDPPHRQVYISSTCRPGFTLAHELGHLFLGGGHSRNWDSALMQHPENCGSASIDDLECRMAREDQDAWREYGRRRYGRR